VEYLKAMGFPNDELLAAGKALVIAKAEASYLREVKKGMVTVTCEEMAIEGRILFVHQKILNSRGKIAVDARIESIFMDMNTRRAMDVPADFKAAFLSGAKG
jgi:acyl-CoA thioesterase FadM